MERLLEALKITEIQTAYAYYVFIFIVALVLVGTVAITYLSLRGTNLRELQLQYPSININYVLYGFAAIIVIIIAVSLFNSQYGIDLYSKKTGIYRDMPTSKVFWKPGTTMNPHDPFNLKLFSDDFPMTRADTYTVGAEMYVVDSRSDEKKFGPYRHLFHRGSNDLSSFVRDSPGSTPRGEGGLNDGLPASMNPGVFLDGFTNDLVIFIDTDPTYGKGSYRESIRIMDVPLKKPFYLLITVHDNIAEVFINCKLMGTKLLKGNPRAVQNDWFGRTGFARAQAIVQNLTLYDTDLYAIEIMKGCGKEIQLPKDTAPTKGSSC